MMVIRDESEIVQCSFNSPYWYNYWLCEFIIFLILAISLLDNAQRL